MSEAEGRLRDIVLMFIVATDFRYEDNPLLQEARKRGLEITEEEMKQN